jgi:hypothetical protein
MSEGSLVDAVGNSSSRFVDNSKNVQTRDGSASRLSVNVDGNGDNGLRRW